MTSRQNVLYDKVLGFLLGGAIGDAFGIRLEMMHYLDIEEQYGRVTHFEALPRREPTTRSPLERFYPFGEQMALEDGFHPLGRWSREVGAYTDDTRYQLIACQAILRKGGPVDGRDLAAEWLNYRLMAEGAPEHAPTWSWAGPQRTYARTMGSLDFLVRMATAQRPCTPGWDGPLGLIHAGDPAAAAEMASPFAVAIASAMMPGATIDTAMAEVMRYSAGDGEYAEEFAGRMRRLLEIAATCGDVFDLRAPFYHEMLVTFPPWKPVFALEMVPAALALCVIARGDAEQAIVGAANLGRDADTIASMAGQLCGTLRGASSLPPAWVAQVLRANPEPDLEQVAERLCDVLVAQAEARQEWARGVLGLG